MEDYGEFLIASTCFRLPYKKSRLLNFFERIIKEYQINVTECEYIDTKKEIDYQLIWDGVDYKSSKFNLELLNTKVISRLEFNINNDLNSRLEIMYFKGGWYEIALIFSYTAIIESKVTKINQRLEIAESISNMFFEEVEAYYGLYQIEKSAPYLDELISSFEPIEYNRAYFSNDIIEISPVLQSLFNTAPHKKNFKKGKYMRFEPLEKFNYKENVTIQLQITQSLKPFFY